MTAKRTDTEILNWLIAEGYVIELRRFGEHAWDFETDDEGFSGTSAREAIIAAMEALDG